MSLRVLFVAALLFVSVHAQAGRRALLIGINDYTASRIVKEGDPAPERDWPNLNGTLNDVLALREILIAFYGFDPSDIVTLTDQRATRVEILKTLHQHLVVPAAKDDVLLFCYAGHGSQVRNSRSDEPDKLDESIVPADSRAGARDIRDKELGLLFNRILDRGARLTVVLDTCHSGSGARGLATGERPRGVEPDLRDVADGATGPRPENRNGALVLSATEDFDKAWETRGEDGLMHGSFSWALLRSVVDAAENEPAEETFLRARSRMRAATRFQEPTIAGMAEARLAPFLGTRAVARESRPAVIVDRVRGDGTVVLQGGWAEGLSVGSELRVGDARLTVTAMDGLTRSEARVDTRSRMAVGEKAQVVSLGRTMRVWMPTASADMTAVARRLRAEARRRGVRWIDDPTETTPEWLLRHDGREWELIGPRGRVERAAIANVPKGATLFVQFPAPAIELDDVEIAARTEDADYILAGRFTNKGLEYAWIRPATTTRDRAISGLPVRSAWTTSTAVLRDAAARLRRIRGWQQLESPARNASPYRLDIRRDGDALVAGKTYDVVARCAAPPRRIAQRYLYAFVIDSAGDGILLFPKSGSVENRFPIDPDDLPREMPLATIEVKPPYGVDTYFLLTTDEPLPNPWILEWDGVRTARLAESVWSIEKLVLESKP